MSAIDPPPAASMLQTLDRVLRGDYLRSEAFAAGRIEVPTGRFVRLAVLLGVVYGVSLSTFGIFQGTDGAALQMFSVAAKVPLLFVLTLLVTFPSLYVFAALQRLPLDMGNTLRLMLLANVVHLAVIASLGPVFAFFAASTDSYAFMKLLNVAFFVAGGLLGFVILRSATTTMFHAEASDATDGPASAQVLANQRTSRVLRVWCFVYGVVGAQMGWLLRPFIGSPDLPFAFLRERDGSIFEGILRSIAELFGA